MLLSSVLLFQGRNSQKWRGSGRIFHIPQSYSYQMISKLQSFHVLLHSLVIEGTFGIFQNGRLKHDPIVLKAVLTT